MLLSHKRYVIETDNSFGSKTFSYNTSIFGKVESNQVILNFEGQHIYDEMVVQFKKQGKNDIGRFNFSLAYYINDELNKRWEIEGAHLIALDMESPWNFDWNTDRIRFSLTISYKNMKITLGQLEFEFR